jgi:ABC-type branched-subunit amino acid transport system ATPase component
MECGPSGDLLTGIAKAVYLAVAMMVKPAYLIIDERLQRLL